MSLDDLKRLRDEFEQRKTDAQTQYAYDSDFVKYKGLERRYNEEIAKLEERIALLEIEAKSPAHPSMSLEPSGAITASRSCLTKISGNSRAILISALVVIIGIASLLLLKQPDCGGQSSFDGCLPTPTSVPPTPTSVPSTSTSAPPTSTSFPPREFSVVVAGFAMQNTDGLIVEDIAADRVGEAVFSVLQKHITFLSRWDQPGVGRILDSDPQERYEHALKIGQALGADVVIYGLISTEGYQTRLQPSFYFAQAWVDQDGELFTRDVLLPIVFLTEANETSGEADIGERVQVIQLFLEGLEYYLSGKYNAAYEAFLQAATMGDDFFASAYIFAGNSANRAGEYESALKAFDRVLSVEPDYARSLIGRGVVLAQLGEKMRETYDPTAQLSAEAKCSDPLPEDARRFGLLALKCFQEAIETQNSSIETQSTLRAYVNAGQVNSWLADFPGGEHRRWNEAKTQFEQALKIYNDIPDEQRVSFNYFGALAHAGVAKIYYAQDTRSPQICTEAGKLYENAISLLQKNADQSPYVQELINEYRNEQNEMVTCV